MFQCGPAGIEFILRLIQFMTRYGIAFYQPPVAFQAGFGQSPARLRLFQARLRGLQVQLQRCVVRNMTRGWPALTWSPSLTLSSVTSPLISAASTLT